MPVHTTAAPTLANLRQYAWLFVNRWDAFMDHTPTGGWRCQHQPLTKDRLVAGLAGQTGLGFYSVDRYGSSRWVCLDLDDVDRGARLGTVIDQLQDPRAALLEQTRRGLHLWIFVQPSPWQQVRQWGRQLADAAGLAGIEVFPKGVGLNGVRAPLTRHPKDGLIYSIIDMESGEIAPDPWALIASRKPRPLPAMTSRCLPPRRPAWAMHGGTNHHELVAEVERLTQLRYYAPERAIGRCPFHDDRHPSFGVVGGFWRCFAGCGEGGLAAFQHKVAGQAQSPR